MTSKEQTTEKTNDPGRTTAEWVSLGVSLLIVLALAGLVTYDYFATGNEPPTIEVTPQLEQVRQEGDAFYLPVEVANTGDQTAQDVSVEVALQAGEGDPESAQFTVAFLPGGGTEEAVVVFREDPSRGEISSSISFVRP